MGKTLKRAMLLALVMTIATASYLACRNKLMDQLYAEAGGIRAFFAGLNSRRQL
jgi:hypothetical protein